MADEDLKNLAKGFARYAFDYIEAARTVDDTIGRRPEHDFISPMPAYFLAMHGVELSLKAFLMCQGMAPKQFGHNLRTLYETAQKHGLFDVYKPRASDDEAIGLLVDLNADQGLRYMREGEKDFPSFGIVEPLAVRLHQAIAPVVGYERTFNVHFGDQ
ncbi:hypothetical protein G3O01_10280 [Burkholderia sp. Ac-20365]|nr:hypothetical protein [Burkholderia sp. Ac-20365]